MLKRCHCILKNKKLNIIKRKLKKIMIIKPLELNCRMMKSGKKSVKKKQSTNKTK
jgi:hypothetical protein